MKYFKINEFVCRCGCGMPPEARQNIEALVDNVLAPLREAYGKPIYVNSGYRCPRHHAEVGGVARSQHLVGEAAGTAIACCARPLRATPKSLTERYVNCLTDYTDIARRWRALPDDKVI